MIVEFSLLGVIIAQLVFVCWREWQNSKLIDQLTNKIMSRDYNEYSSVALNMKAFDNTKSNGSNRERVKKTTDPVLGANF